MTYTTRGRFFFQPCDHDEAKSLMLWSIQIDLHQRWWIFQLYGLDILIKATMKISLIPDRQQQQFHQYMVQQLKF